jgi:pterin-4a-carbinolamine dehydratase
MEVQMADLHTPDEGGITEADIELAEPLDLAGRSDVYIQGAFGE